MDATYAQTSFLGGEFSQYAQGRWDHPKYKTALARCLNAFPTDEGTWVRRPGFSRLGPTNLGAAGRVIPFEFTAASPYNLEFTDSTLRMWNGTQLVTTNDNQKISTISNASPAVFSVPLATTWKTGDQVIFYYFNDPRNAVAGAALLNRQFILTMLTATTFTITDAITGVRINSTDLLGVSQGTGSFDGPFSSAPVSDGPINGSPVTRSIVSSNPPFIAHVSEITTPYTVAGADWHSIRLVQGLELGMLLHSQVAPQALQVLSLPTANEFATFEYSTAQFQDGPYLDPPPSAIASPSGTSGVIQLTVGYNAWVNTTTYGYGVPATYNGQDYISNINNNVGNTPGTGSQWVSLPLGGMISNNGFVATDVGRHIRLFSAPLVWNPNTTYAQGANVAYNGSYFTSLANSNTNNEPDISLTEWVINTSAAYYTWGIITAVNSPNNVSLQIMGPNLGQTTALSSWAVGAWSNTTGWPTCGCYQGGRFWFAGAIPNRVDSSSSNSPFVMSPTQQDGTVTDNNGISYTFNSDSIDQILWMTAITGGILCGTQKGEKLLTSGTSGGPITPSSIAESPTTKYGSANMLPVHTGLTTCFVQRQGRRLLEYLADVFSQRYYGPDLTTFARHIGQRTFEELAYEQEPVPIVWGRMNDGSLVGTTYRRVSLFSTQDPEFNGWHQHTLGSGRVVESLCVGPSMNGELDTLAMVTNDPSTNVRYVESMTPMLDETDPLTNAWFLDCAVTPPAAEVVSYGTPSANYVRFYGLHYLDGKAISVFAAALDCGNYVVENGTVDVPLGILDPISGYTFDIPQFQVLQPLISQFSSMAVTIVNGSVLYTIPCVIGYNYISQGQMCRPVLPADSGARNGPGFGKKKKQSKYAISMVNSLGAKVGTDGFTKMQPVPVASPLGANPPYLSGFTGIRRDTLKNDYNFDSMLCWQSTRPFPLSVNNIGGFIDTEDTP